MAQDFSEKIPYQKMTLPKKHWIVDDMSVIREVYFIVEIKKISEKLIQLFRENMLTVKPYLRTEQEVIDLFEQTMRSKNFTFPTKFDDIEIEYDDIRLTCGLRGSDKDSENTSKCSEVFLRVDSHMQSLFLLPTGFMVTELGFCDGHIDFTFNQKPNLCLKIIASILKPFFGFSSSDYEDKSNLLFKQPWLKTRSLIIFDSNHEFWFNLTKKLNHIKYDLFEWEQLSGSIEWVQSPMGIGNFMNSTASDEAHLKHLKAITQAIKDSF
jgi:hypothetical protein